MDKLTLFLTLALASFSKGLELQILGELEYSVKAGAQLSFTCYFNQGLEFTLKYRAQWVHKSLATNDSPEVVLTEQETLMPEASPNFYDIAVKFNSTTVDVTLTIKQVQANNDGEFICRAVPIRNSETDTLEQKVTVNVIKKVITAPDFSVGIYIQPFSCKGDVSDIQLTFDGEGPVHSIDSVEIQRQEGIYGVTCRAAGFSPDAQLTIYLHDSPQAAETIIVKLDQLASKALGARRYEAESSATLALTAQHSGKRLSCRAKATFEDAVEKEASVPLVVIVLEPTISCDKNVSARPGDRYVKITCRVDHSNVDVSGFSWYIAETDETIYPGNITSTYDEVKVEEVRKGEVTDVTLDLYQAAEWHFNTVYYLNVHSKTGQKFKEKATLIRLSPTNCASSLGLTPVLASLLVLLYLLRKL